MKLALELISVSITMRAKAVARFLVSLAKTRSLESAKRSASHAMLLGNIVIVSKLISYKTPRGDSLEQVILRINKVLDQPITAKPKKKRKAKKK
jgi:hypothetical protein